ncbi:protein of unknown function [Paraburkholderia dioscoreae]|uniref:Uncharacterized protein n=1 Tax=Paraburkholderia dioscoreae TaxID=2604047 RepID=A0A5Q4YY25_9BURK|nr:protein of unknown function [Paraburkholderia dioscoreae]
MRIRRSNTCDRAAPHGLAARRRMGWTLKGFPGFTQVSIGTGSHSTPDENGINKKRLQRLISIVNLGKPFRVFLQQV